MKIHKLYLTLLIIHSFKLKNKMKIQHPIFTNVYKVIPSILINQENLCMITVNNKKINNFRVWKISKIV